MADGADAHLRTARGSGEKTFGNSHFNDPRFGSTCYMCCKQDVSGERMGYFPKISDTINISILSVFIDSIRDITLPDINLEIFQKL